MIVSCPKCGKHLKVDDSLSGRRGKCPACQTTFTIGHVEPAPAPVAAPVAAQVVPAAAPVQAYAPAPMRRGPAGAGGSLAAKVFMLLGALAMAGSFGAPWWHVSITPVPDVKQSDLSKDEKDEIMEEDKEAAEEHRDKMDFYRDYKLERKRDKAKREFDKKYEKPEDRKGRSCSIRIWGWNSTTGILCLVFGLLVLIFVILAMSIRAIGRWSWIGSFAAMGMGIPIVILSLMWWLGSPGADVRYQYTQGAFIGVFVALGGGVLTVAFSLIDGIVGLVGMVRRLRAG